jgi:gentisate 1,2-dioxygenase
MSHELGRLEDLPQDYRDDLTKLNLVPLWPSLRAVLPPGVPTRATQATHWPYATLKPLLLKAGELTPIEKAERRVLVLANPGHGLENMKASPAIYLGMQLLLPGEWAPSHRHTPNAVRMIVEGEGAYTTVDGEKCPMSRGDLILTPTGLWHEHGHDGTDPVVWLDVLDLPLVYYMEASYHINGSRQTVKQGSGDRAWTRAGVVPTQVFSRSDKRYPMLRYPWVDARAALVSMADNQPDLECVQVTYVNPETGDDAENILGFYALMLKARPDADAAGALTLAGVPPDRRRRGCVHLRQDLRSGRGRHLLRARLRTRHAEEPIGRPARICLHRRRIPAAPQARRV